MDVSPLNAAGMRVSQATLDLDAYRRDLWPRATLALRDGVLPPTPSVVAWPERAEHVAAALEWAQREGVAVVPYGAGSGVCGGAAGLAGSLVLDLKRLTSVGPVDAEAREVRVGAGLLGQHLEDRLARQGWQTGHSPSSLWCSTVGGYVAARSAGQFSSRYGVFDDMLLGAEAVTPTGPLRTGRLTPSGEEDLQPILCGSEGSLAVVTDATLRVVPLPAQRDYRGFAFDDVDEACAAMRAILQADLWPSVVRLYDPVDTRVGGRLAHKRAREGAEQGSRALARLREAVERAPGLRRHLLDLPLALPGLVNRLAKGISERVLLIIGFEGSPGLVAAQWDAALPLLSGGVALGAEPGQRWYAHRHDISYKLAPMFVSGAFADTMEVAAPWSRLSDLYDGVREALGRHTLVMAHFSHAYPEGCSIYFSFCGAGRLDVYDAAWAEALEAARAAGGTVTHHHGVGQLKARAAAREAGAAVRVWREVKARLDPQGIMNPGRLFPHDVPIEDGPPPPTGGPIYRLDRESMVAEVDPYAPAARIDELLARDGLALRHRPATNHADALHDPRRWAHPSWEVPLFALQARFSDGVSVRLGGPPRSAAGPDLRWGLLRRARPELMGVPVRPLDLRVCRPSSDADVREARPAAITAGGWGFHPAAAPVATWSEGGA